MTLRFSRRTPLQTHVQTERRQACLAIASLASAMLPATRALAQAYPDKPIKFVVPYVAGGGVDKIAHILGERLAKAPGQAVVIDNRGGAAGNIGTELAARAAPDGYTILMGAAPLAINESLYRRLPFNAVRDLAPISLIAKTPNILAVHPKVAARTLPELIQLAKDKPGVLNYASAGSGTTPHLAAELFKSMAGIDIVHVPYKGSGPAVLALLSGEVDLMLSPALTLLPYIKTNKLRGIAMTGSSRSPAFQELPTMAEAGLPGYEASQWYGVLAPMGTPAPILARLHLELVKLVQMPDVIQSLASDGSDPIGSTPDAFRDYLKAEINRWAKAIPADQKVSN